MLYTGDRFPAWQGSFFVGGMAGRQLARLTPSVDRPGRIEQEETLAYGIGRVRDVRQGPDGYIYLAVEHTGPAGSGRAARTGAGPVASSAHRDSCVLSWSVASQAPDVDDDTPT